MTRSTSSLFAPAPSPFWPTRPRVFSRTVRREHARTAAAVGRYFTGGFSPVRARVRRTRVVRLCAHAAEGTGRRKLNGSTNECLCCAYVTLHVDSATASTRVSTHIKGPPRKFRRKGLHSRPKILQNPRRGFGAFECREKKNFNLLLTACRRSVAV